LSSDLVITGGGLEISVTHSEEGALVHLNGRVNIDSSPALRDRFLGILQGETSEAVIVDLADVSYIDCSGIATLIEGLKIARSRKSTLYLKGVHGRLLHLLEVTGVLSLFGAIGQANAPSESRVM
jgi:anti-sigma B factor antagonist